MKRLFVPTFIVLLGLFLAACGPGAPGTGAPTPVTTPTIGVDATTPDVDTTPGMAITPVLGTPGPTTTPAPDTTPGADEDSLLDVALRDGRFATLVTAIQLTGLEETLRDIGPYTIFAPTDEAFATLPENVFEQLQQNPDLLAEILSYHVVNGRFLASDVTDRSALTSLQGAEILIDQDGDTVVLNGTVQIVDTDIEATNGVIHIIDAVLLPPGVQLPQ